MASSWLVEARLYSIRIGFQIVSVHTGLGRSQKIAGGATNHKDSFVLEGAGAMLQANLVEGAEIFDLDAFSLTEQIIDSTDQSFRERRRIYCALNLNHGMVLEVELRNLHTLKLAIEHVAFEQGILLKV